MDYQSHTRYHNKRIPYGRAKGKFLVFPPVFCPGDIVTTHAGRNYCVITEWFTREGKHKIYVHSLLNRLMFSFYVTDIKDRWSTEEARRLGVEVLMKKRPKYNVLKHFRLKGPARYGNCHVS